MLAPGQVSPAQGTLSIGCLSRYGPPILKPLGKKTPPMPEREFLQSTKDLIAMLLIEIRRLKAEGIQVRVPCGAPAGLLLGKHQQAVSMASAAQVLCDPQQVAAQPATPCYSTANHP